MYGIINKAIEEMAIAAGGPEVWDQICREAQCQDRHFVNMQHYPDAETFNLVNATSKVLKVPADDILRRFGRHWILYTSQQGFGPMMRFFGNSVRGILDNLNVMHNGIGDAMPKMRPPRIDVEDIDERTIRVHYVSERSGLAPMVVGLLEGLGEKFDEPLEVRQVAAKQDGADHDEFEIRFC